jgi:hypothetical protein
MRRRNSGELTRKQKARIFDPGFFIPSEAKTA